MSRRKTKFPPWLKKRLPHPGRTRPVAHVLEELSLNTVCREAHCPNRGECYACGTATFMILGDTCTRDCAFCAVRGGSPQPPDPDEPARLAEAVRRMDLRHVVVTSVTRDDLPDGGSAHFAAVIRALHKQTGATVEVLVPDFEGRAEDVDGVLDAGPEVFNHNVETVPRLYPEVRPQADFERSLGVLARAAAHRAGAVTKSGLMLGLGETEDEVLLALRRLREAGCRVVTLGQYLAPSEFHHPVVDFVPPQHFEHLKERALDMGFQAVASGPFVRSSYGAAELAAELLQRREHTS
ncbi:MAG: lipoyl synthase [Planctomycetota bacterium]